MNSLLLKTFLLSKFNLLRLVALGLDGILILNCVLYGAGSLMVLSLENFWCQSYSWNQVTSYNRIHNTSTGIGGCYVNDRLVVDEEKILLTDSNDVALAAIVNPKLNGWSIIKCIIYITWAIILLQLFMTYLIVVATDLKMICKDRNTNTNRNSNANNSNEAKRDDDDPHIDNNINGKKEEHHYNYCCLCCGIGTDKCWQNCLSKRAWNEYILLSTFCQKLRATDSPYAITSLQIKQIFECFLQS